jgi:hypothetical protein
MSKTTSVKLLLISGLALMGQLLFATTWQTEYERGLKAAAENDWMTARELFLAAAAKRSEDTAEPTRLPGPVTEPRVWRGGSPYSPNFGAAYSAYRIGKDSGDATERQQYLILAAAELKGLVDKGQAAADTLKVLGNVYKLLDDKESLAGLKEVKANFNVDNSFLAAEDSSGPIKTANPQNPKSSTTQASPTAPQVTKSANGTIIKVKAGTHSDVSNLHGDTAVETLDNKFAIIIGNTKSPDVGTELAFAANDAMMVKNALMQYAGYAEGNITVMTDGTATQIREAITATAAKIPSNAVVLIYFTGVAAHLNGTDFLAGNNIEFATDSSKMVEKSALFTPFTSKGANVFFFAQCNRAMSGNDYFGKQRIGQGTLSESYATIPGANVGFIVRDGQAIGVYTAAFIRTLQEFHTNSVPINEFCWNVFYSMRGGRNSDSQRGGAAQTPTLPILTNLGPRSPF